MPEYQFDDDQPEPTMSELGYDDDPPSGRAPLPLTRRQLPEPEVYDDQQPQQAAPQAPQMQVVVQEDAPEEDYQEVVSHVDRRLRIAQYWRMVLDSNLFDDASPEAKVVQNRLRKFAHDEIEVLFGMKAVPAMATGVSQFTPEEVDALKALAAATVAAKKKSGPPTLKPMSAAPQPPAAPVLKPIQQAPRPQVQLQQRTAPTQQRQPAPRPAPQQQPAPQTQQPAVPGVLQTNVQAGNPSLATDPRVPEEVRQDPTLRIKNGHVYIQQRNPDGELLWVSETGMPRPLPLLKDVTPVAKPTGALQPVPMPPAEAMTLISEQRASEEALQNLEKLATRLDPVFRGRIS